MHEPTMTPQEAGRQAEARAESHLLKNGFSTVHRNYSWKTGEIDLIIEKRPPSVCRSQAPTKFRLWFWRRLSQLLQANKNHQYG